MAVFLYWKRRRSQRRVLWALAVAARVDKYRRSLRVGGLPHGWDTRSVLCAEGATQGRRPRHWPGGTDPDVDAAHWLNVLLLGVLRQLCHGDCLPLRHPFQRLQEQDGVAAHNDHTWKENMSAPAGMQGQSRQRDIPPLQEGPAQEVLCRLTCSRGVLDERATHPWTPWWPGPPPRPAQCSGTGRNPAACPSPCGCRSVSLQSGGKRRAGGVRSGYQLCVPLHGATEHTRHAPFIFLSMYLRTGGRRGHSSVERTASATTAKGFTTGPWSRTACGAARAASKGTAPRGLRCGRRGCRACLGTAGLAGEWSECQGKRTSSAQALGRPWRRHARRPPRLLCSRDGCGLVRVGYRLRGGGLSLLTWTFGAAPPARWPRTCGS
jgi:hypothetical protein